MRKIILLILMIVIYGSCSNSLKDFIMGTMHIPKMPVQKTDLYKNANKYQQDFLYVYDMIKQSFPHYKDHFTGDFEMEAKKTLNQLSAVTETYQFDFAMQHFMAKLNNNHTYLIKEKETHYYPIGIRFFDGEMVIYNIDENYDEKLIGGIIQSINGKKAHELIDLSLEIAGGETPFQDSAYARHYFRQPSFYKYFKISKNHHKLEIKIKNHHSLFELSPIEAKEIKWRPYRFKKNTLTKFNRNDEYAYKILDDKKLAYLQFNRFMDKPTMLEGIQHYVRKPFGGLAKAYVKHLYRRKAKGKKAIYVTSNPKPFKQVVNEMFEKIHEKKVETLVIDLRYNGGGDLELGNYLLSHIAGTENIKGYGEGLKTSEMNLKIFHELGKKLNQFHLDKYGTPIPDDVWTEEQLDKDFLKRDFYQLQKDSNSTYYLPRPQKQFKGKIYVITGAGTGSAAAMFTVIMKDNHVAEIIGIPPSNLPTGPTVALPLQTPHTKRTMSLSTHLMTRPESSKNNAPFLEMDQYIPLTKNDYFNGIDRAMEYIFSQIEQQHVQVRD